MKKIILSLFCLCMVTAAIASAADDPITQFAHSTVAYFRPHYGSVLRVEGVNVTIDAGEKDALKPGMRLSVMREGAPFRHPVTKEILGKIETPVGKIQVKEAGSDAVVATLVEGEARPGDKVRLSDTKVKMFFCQDKGADWYLADDYYRKLKASGRIEMIDTAMETSDEAKVLAEARRLGAEVALILTMRPGDKKTILHQRLYWVSDGAKFLDSEVGVGDEISKDLKFGEAYFTPKTGDVSMTFDLKFRARLLAVGDIDGDGNQEILISTGNVIRVYAFGVDLKKLWEIKGSAQDDHLWLDTVDLKHNGKAEVVVTSLRSSEVETSIYEFSGGGFSLLWKGKYFVRRLGDGLIAQAYSPVDGFSKQVFRLVWDGGVRVGDALRLPKGVNVYDFVMIGGPGKEPMIFAYDDKGFLNLYDDKGTRVWKSSSDTGGFISTFKKPSSFSYLDAGEWSIKDRLCQRHREVMVVYRVPLAEIAKTIGYKSSYIRTYWWNGLAMEDAVTIEDIRGSLQDYAVSGDKVIVLSNPFLGLKFDNILKGESPLGSMLSVYSVKGR